MTPKAPFNGRTAKATVLLEADAITLLKATFAEITLQGENLHEADEVDAFLDSDPAAGEHELSHDQIALMFAVMKQRMYAKSARRAARTLLDELELKLNSFYQE